MKRTFVIIIALLMLSILNGYLLSKATLIGRFGMTFIYREYTFLKTWWKGGLFIFIAWVAFFVLQGILYRRLGHHRHLRAQWIAILVATIGLLFTYLDFRNTLSHRLLGERFHLGGYLFWIVWIFISIYWLTRKKPALLQQNITGRDSLKEV